MITVTQFRYQAFFVLTLFTVLTLPGVHTGLAQHEGKLLITEVYYDTPGVDSDEEWIEIANLGARSLNLDGIKIGDAHFPGSREGMVRFPPAAVIAPDEAIVVAQSAAGFRSLFGQNPDFEIQDSDGSVPDMLPYDTWAQGDIALNNDGDEVVLLDGTDIVFDAMSYGDSAEILDPSVPNALWGQSLARVPATCDTDTAGDWRPQEAPMPGHLVRQGQCTLPGPQLDIVPSIGLIQGAGESSPRLNEVVTFEGIVTGMSEDRNTRGAIFYSLFVQDAPGSEDGDPATSDAIAVFHGPRRPPYVVGDHIRVTGQVTEYFGLTEIDDSGLRIELLATEQPLPPAVPLQLPDEQVNNYFESLEAMNVQLPDALVTGPTFSGCGFAVVPSNNASTPIIRQALDDAVDGTVPILHHSDVSCGAFPQVKVGDRVHGLQGPLTYHFEQFKIVHQFPQELGLTISDLPEPPQAPRIGANEASVATFNVHDYFDAKNDTGSDVEPTPAQEAVALKERKLAQTIAGALHCPTLLAIQEVENADLLGSLARRLQPSCGFLYDIAHRESVDVRGIDLALMADPRRVQITSVSAQQHCSPLSTGLPDVGVNCPAAQEPLFSRPPLEVDLRLDDEAYLVIVTHFKSKREGEEETAARRLAQAGAVGDRIRGRLQSDSEARIIVLGDFNDYERSAPMAALMREPLGLQNTALQIPLEQRYTYNFGGVSQLLDAILVSPALAPHVVSSSILHLNADYPAGWEDDLEVGFRSSDHDIPFIILDTLVEEIPSPAAMATQQRPATPSVSPTVVNLPTATVAAPTESRDPRRDISGVFVALTIGALVVTAALIYRGSRARN